MTKERLCKDCVHCERHQMDDLSSLWMCTREWRSLLDGEVEYIFPIRVWHARREYCGTAGRGFSARAAREGDLT